MAKKQKLLSFWTLFTFSILNVQYFTVHPIVVGVWNWDSGSPRELGFGFTSGIGIRVSPWDSGIGIRDSPWELGFGIQGFSWDLGIGIRDSPWELGFGIRDSPWELGFGIQGFSWDSGIGIRDSPGILQTPNLFPIDSQSTPNFGHL